MSRELCETTEEDCILCREKLSLWGWQTQLATHIEHIALFILPSNVDESREEQPVASGQAVGLRSTESPPLYSWSRKSSTPSAVSYFFTLDNKRCEEDRKESRPAHHKPLEQSGSVLLPLYHVLQPTLCHTNPSHSAENTVGDLAGPVPPTGLSTAERPQMLA